MRLTRINQSLQLSRDGERQELARSHRRNLGIIGARRDPFIYVEKLRMDDEEAARYSV